MVVILMGVSGAGKTTTGEALATALGWHFEDADWWHPAANVDKMKHGIPLDDSDREPWLQALHEAISQWIREQRNVVLACSALKERYRQTLARRQESEVRFVYLEAARGVVFQRMHSRHGHYMPESLVDSQFAALEVPGVGEALRVDASLNVGRQVEEIRAGLHL